MNVSLSLEDIQERLDKFDEILLDHPRMTEAHHRLASLMLQTKSRLLQHDRAREKARGRPIKSAELWAQPIIGPSGAGKSTCIDTYVDGIYADPKTPDDAIPVLVVTLRSSIRSPRQLQAQILEAYGDPASKAVLSERDYSEALVNLAIREIAREKKTTLVVLDEASNVINGNSSINLSMARAFKSLINDGLFSIVVAGTEGLVTLLNCDPEFKSRQKPIIDFGRLRLEPDDLIYFTNYIGLLESEMQDRGVIDGPLGFKTDAKACGLAYDMSEGVIGIVSRILRMALEDSLSHGSTVLEWHTISAAFRTWRNLDEDQSKRYDPFENGIRKTTAKALEEVLDVESDEEFKSSDHSNDVEA